MLFNYLNSLHALSFLVLGLLADICPILRSVTTVSLGFFSKSTASKMLKSGLSNHGHQNFNIQFLLSYCIFWCIYIRFCFRFYWLTIITMAFSLNHLYHFSWEEENSAKHNYSWNHFIEIVDWSDQKLSAICFLWVGE